MRFSSPLVLGWALLAAASGCYSRPGVPRDKPLSCAGTDAADECPSGLACIKEVCAATTCATDEDCPEGFTCSMKNGCGLPGATGDGGGDTGLVIAPPFDGGPGSPTGDGGGPGPALDGPAGAGDAPVSNPGASDAGAP